MADDSEHDRYAALQKFEKTFHSPIWAWVVDKVDTEEGEKGYEGSKHAEDLEILDISMDCAVFSQLLAEKYKVKRLVCAVRDEKEHVRLKPHVEIRKISLKDESCEDLKHLGKFDIIILKEVLYEVPNLDNFFQELKNNLKDKHSLVFIFSRPKNPPLPIPDTALVAWRKMAPSREQIIEVTKNTGWELDCYSASCPIRINKNEWGAILRSGCLPAIKESPKCTPKEIRDFIECRSSPQWSFEEKVLIFKVWLP